MNKLPFVLIHSPLVGTLTWRFVADYLQAEGYDVFVPELLDDSQSNVPFWQQEVDSVDLPITDGILVGHSGAGALLPAIGEKFTVHGYIFVDAVLLFEPATRLEIMYFEDIEFAQELETFLQAGGQFPNWQDEQLKSIIPDMALRQKLLADVRPRALDFFTERIETTTTWHTKPCAYIQLSESYVADTIEAEKRNWVVLRRNSHHFEMLTNPKEIADLLIQTKEILVHQE